MKKAKSVLDKNSTVAEWVSSQPQSARVFEDLQIDYCCGGNTALAAACGQKQLDADTVVAQLKEANDDASSDVPENWQHARLAELCDHITQTHHGYLRQELPRLSDLIEKVVEAHGARHAELKELRHVFAALRSELEPHMFKEEQVLFPAIRRMEQASDRLSFPFGTVANPIRMMEHEHDVAGSALRQIRELTGGFLPPEGACNTYCVMLDALCRLEGDLHQHIHKENNILFPRAQELEDQLAASSV